MYIKTVILLSKQRSTRSVSFTESVCVSYRGLFSPITFIHVHSHFYFNKANVTLILPPKLTL